MRFSLKSKEAYERFRLLETLLILRGRDVADFWDKIIGNAIGEYGGELKGRPIVSGEQLRQIALGDYGKEISKQLLKSWRETRMVSGVEYFGAVNGERMVYRYDLEKCLPLIEGFEQKGF